MLILQVKAEVHPSQQTFLEHLPCDRHVHRGQGILTSVSLRTRKYKQLQIESVHI